MLLFVTSNKALANGHRDARRLDARTAPGCRAPTPRRSSTARSRRPTTPAGAGRRLHGDHQVHADPARLRRHRAADPVATFASAAETVNRATHTTPGANVATAGSYVVSYWADKSSATTGLDPSRRSDPAQPLARHRPRTHHSMASDLNAPAPVGAHRPAPPRPTPRRPRRRCGPSCCRPTRTSNPNVAPVASFTVNCPTATCTVDASGSTDTAPGTIASYAWDFGDGATGTGVTTTHTYTTGGAQDDHARPSPTTRAWRPRRRPARPTPSAAAAPATSRCPGTTGCVPDRPRTNTPRISTGEIWDIEVVGRQLNRVFIAGNFTSARRTRSPRPRRSTSPTCSLQPQDRPDRHQLPPDVRRRRRDRGRGHARTAPSCSSPARSTPSTGWPSRRSPASTSPPARR